MNASLLSLEWWNSKVNLPLIQSSSVWHQIEGIPIQTWSKPVFERILQECDKLIEIDWFKTAGSSLGVLRAKVFRTPEFVIYECLVLKFNNKVFKITINTKTSPSPPQEFLHSSSSSVVPSKDKAVFSNKGKELV
ncbi:hypothetical protein AMTR_s00089p00020050 [Amborella trichopoda]|uniref:Uncharacterized protein n=1 Tax=Amborella trichopoda TaxID=13333 RepID=W1P1L6_AMBTC|nr:hypothetical protein AMTR_s00089p00020050 [Amborella trichopoda]